MGLWLGKTWLPSCFLVSSTLCGDGNNFIFSDSEPFHKWVPHKLPMFWYVLGVWGLFSLYSSTMSLCSAKEKPCFFCRGVACGGQGFIPPSVALATPCSSLLCAIRFKWEIFSSQVLLHCLACHIEGKNRPLWCRFFQCPCHRLFLKQTGTLFMAGVQSRATYCSLGAQVTVYP